MANVNKQLTPAAANNLKNETTLNYQELVNISNHFDLKVKSPSVENNDIQANNYGESGRNYFNILHYDSQGNQMYFNFMLLPAINPGLQGYSGAQVPGAGPGIRIKSKMRHRAITIPGSTPVIQTVGLEGITIELVGLITGFESFKGVRSYSTDKNSPSSMGDYIDSFTTSTTFRNEVVAPGVPVELEIKASNGYILDETGKFVQDKNEKAIYIKSKIIVCEFEQMVREFNKTYYYLKAYMISYPTAKRLDPITEESIERDKRIKEAKERAEEAKRLEEVKNKPDKPGTNRTLNRPDISNKPGTNRTLNRPITDEDRLKEQDPNFIGPVIPKPEEKKPKPRPPKKDEARFFRPGWN